MRVDFVLDESVPEMAGFQKPKLYCCISLHQFWDIHYWRYRK